MEEKVNKILDATKGTLSYYHPIGEYSYALHADFTSMVGAEAFVGAMRESFEGLVKLGSFSGSRTESIVTVSMVLGA